MLSTNARTLQASDKCRHMRNCTHRLLTLNRPSYIWTPMTLQSGSMMPIWPCSTGLPVRSAKSPLALVCSWSEAASRIHQTPCEPSETRHAWSHPLASVTHAAVLLTFSIPVQHTELVALCSEEKPILLLSLHMHLDHLKSFAKPGPSRCSQLQACC